LFEVVWARLIYAEVVDGHHRTPDEPQRYPCLFRANVLPCNLWFSS